MWGSEYQVEVAGRSVAGVMWRRLPDEIRDHLDCKGYPRHRVSIFIGSLGEIKRETSPFCDGQRLASMDGSHTHLGRRRTPSRGDLAETRGQEQSREGEK